MSGLGLTIIGISFIFLMTTLGGAAVFFFKKSSGGKMKSLFLGFASGLMIAAAVWSLIVPALDQSAHLGSMKVVPAVVGIILGVLFLLLLDKVLPHMFKEKKNDSNFAKTAKLYIAVTLHNIPEGLAVGLAFGNAFSCGEMSSFYAALWLAVGIGLQNLPEGSALALPMREGFNSNKKAFFFNCLSGAIEPVMAVLGIFLSGVLAGVMPYLLAFAAGTMLFVVAEELIPEAKFSHSSHIGSWGFIIGFLLMMILDVALG
ncbi:MAG: ZIP family metal transporter [Clostridia bacterium]|nr:ZIP family metal transporter [Clostridia bacterium]